MDFLNLRLENKKIANVKYTKFLGLYIDENLDWNYHIDQLCNKISRGLYCMRSVKKLATKMVIIVWGCMGSKTIYIQQKKGYKNN